MGILMNFPGYRIQIRNSLQNGRLLILVKGQAGFNDAPTALSDERVMQLLGV